MVNMLKGTPSIFMKKMIKEKALTKAASSQNAKGPSPTGSPLALFF
jgi:hypothetical protein